MLLRITAKSGSESENVIGGDAGACRRGVSVCLSLSCCEGSFCGTCVGVSPGEGVSCSSVIAGCDRLESESGNELVRGGVGLSLAAIRADDSERTEGAAAEPLEETGSERRWDGVGELGGQRV